MRLQICFAICKGFFELVCYSSIAAVVLFIALYSGNIFFSSLSVRIDSRLTDFEKRHSQHLEEVLEHPGALWEPAVLRVFSMRLQGHRCCWSCEMWVCEGVSTLLPLWVCTILTCLILNLAYRKLNLEFQCLFLQERARWRAKINTACKNQTDQTNLDFYSIMPELTKIPI